MKDKTSFYDLKFETPQGKEIFMSNYKGKLILIVNTATKCKLAVQFNDLENLHQKYKNKGLVILGFPSNNFANQEPMNNDSMENYCKLNFGVTFQLSKKIDVKGKNKHPIFTYLTNNLAGILGEKIKWNFTKFLISPEGKPLKRYSPLTKPKSIEKDIIKYLK